MDSPLESDEESSDDDNSGSPRALRVTDRGVPTTSRAVKRAMEYINSCSDLQVKKALDQIKRAKQGDSHCQGDVSKNMDFRNSRCETFLFDTGTGVSIIGVAIARDNRDRVIKLKTLQVVVNLISSAPV